MQARNRHVLQAAGGRNRRHQKRNRGRTLSWGWGRIPKTEGSRLDNREHLEASTCTHCFFAPLNPGAGRFRARSPRGWETAAAPALLRRSRGRGRRGSRLRGQLLLSPEMPLGPLRDRSRNDKEEGTRPVWVSPWFPATAHLRTASSPGGASSPLPAPDGARREDSRGRWGLREEQLGRGEWGGEQRRQAPPARVSKLNR